MAKLRIFAVIAFLACLAITNVTAEEADDGQFRDENGNVCPPCIVTAEYRPVCGTNGKTYPNRSVLDCHSKCKRSTIDIQYGGYCA